MIRARVRPSELVAALRPRSGSFSGEVLQSFATNALTSAIGAVTGFLLARLLGAEGRGELQAIQALPMLVAAMGQLGLNDAVIYFGGRDRTNVGRYAVSAAVLTGILGLPIVVVAAFAARFVLASYRPEVVLACQLFMGLLFLNAVDGLAIATSRARHDISLWNALRMAPRLLWLVLVVLFFVLGFDDPVRIALAYLLAYAVLAPLLVLPVRRHLAGFWRPDSALFWPLLRFGLPVAAGVAPRLLNERIDQLVIAAMLPPRALGLYTVATNWTGLAQLPALTLTAVAFSKMAGMTEGEAKRRFVRMNLWATGAAAAAAAVVLAALTPFVLRWVRPEFVEATPVAWVLLLAVIVRSVTWMLQIAFQGFGRPALGMASQWIGLACLVAAAVLLIPAYGALGAAWSLVVGSAAALVAALALAPYGLRAEPAQDA